MITKLSLTNFKSHRHTELEPSQLTLLTGVNNCGKSSIIQSLLLLRQSFLKNRLGTGLDLNKDLVEIGVGNDALYRAADTGIISFILGDSSQNNANESELEELVFEFDADNALDDTFLPFKEGCSKPNLEQLKKMSLFNNDFQYLSAGRLAGTSDFIKSSYEVQRQRQLSLSNGRGELLGNFLFEYQGDPIFDYIDLSERPRQLIDQVQYWEQRISSGITVTVKEKDDKTGFTILYGSNGEEGQKSIENLRAENIGFGVSYSLAVVVALLSAKPGALLLIENPEAHLHPAGQAELAKLMCRVAQQGIQVIVETHSDHIINGVLVSCKKREEGEIGIDKDKVSIYYLKGQDKKHAAMIEKVEIGDGGILEYQPQGFFDQIENDREYIIMGEAINA